MKRFAVKRVTIKIFAMKRVESGRVEMGVSI
jgi:hypothetical protein